MKQSFFTKWGVLIVLSLALAIIIIDTTILNVSLATIIRDLHTDIQKIQWVITAYSLMLAAFTITGGRIGDLFGRKKMFMLGAIIFATGSFISSISTSVPMLIWGEAIIEGIGAALMLPATSSLLVSSFSGRDRGIAFGVWGGIAGASAAVGPIIGGFFTTYYSWRWAFRINIGVVALLLLGSILIKESQDREHAKQIDWLGILFSALGMFFVAFGIIESSNYGWWKAKEVFMLGSFAAHFSWDLSVTVFSIVWGLVFLLFFILYELRREAKGKTPLVSMKIFRNRQFTSGVLTNSVLSLGLTGITFVLPVFYQAVRGFDAFHTGFGLLPMSLALLIFAPVSATLVKFFRPKTITLIGLGLNVLSYVVLVFSISPTASILTLAPGLALFGAGLGLVFGQINNLTLSALGVESAGEASGINNTMRQVGATLGSSILGAILISSIGTNIASNIQSSIVIPDAQKPAIETAIAAQTSGVEFGGGATFAQAMPQEITNEITRISHDAITEGNRKTLLYGIGFALLSFFAGLFIPRNAGVHHDESVAIPAGH